MVRKSNLVDRANFPSEISAEFIVQLRIRLRHVAVSRANWAFEKVPGLQGRLYNLARSKDEKFINDYDAAIFEAWGGGNMDIQFASAECYARDGSVGYCEESSDCSTQNEAYASFYEKSSACSAQNEPYASSYEESNACSAKNEAFALRKKFFP
jgi:hypothetical protein